MEQGHALVASGFRNELNPMSVMRETGGVREPLKAQNHFAVANGSTTQHDPRTQGTEPFAVANTSQSQDDSDPATDKP